MIYQLAYILLKSRPMAFLAGLLAATSYTSINLSIMLLSETLYVFLFLTGFLLFLYALENDKVSHFILSGIFIGGAILVRPVGQFWIFGMLLIAFMNIWNKFHNYRFHRVRETIKRMKKTALAVLMVLLIISPWIIRNKLVHDTATLTFSSSGGPANIAAFALEPLIDRPYRKIIDDWDVAYIKDNNKTTITQEERYILYRHKTYEIMRQYPVDFIKAYVKLVGENLFAICDYHRLLLTESKGKMVRYEYLFRKYKLNFLNFFLSISGLIILFGTRRLYPAIVLGSVYFYYILLIGFTRWQGSRLFFPGQIAAVILIAVTLIFITRQIIKILRR